MSGFGIAPAILASLAAAGMAVIGIALVARFHKMADRLLPGLTAFAGGLLVAAGLVHLLPEAMELEPLAPMYFLGGLVFVTMVHLFTHRHGRAGSPLAALVPLLGISFHSFVDGLIYGAVFSRDMFTGLTSVSGLIFHELAEGMILFVLVRTAGFSLTAAVITAILGAAATTPLGAVLSVYALDGFIPDATGMLLAIAGGALLGIGSTHLVSDIPRQGRARAAMVFMVGALLATTVFTVFGHAHSHGPLADHPHNFADHLDVEHGEDDHGESDHRHRH